ncbi:NADPH-dependent FMN reductase [Blastopirellula retiformator]|uniref:FMN-dependent NADPH-azoreductase n=1 Tax=Blastopirellula retiformator TaxID=2527970 RepID=A0A5C5VLA8_9BACT|nr:NAD(P)H-dependent oxidoreductase [Blastopirellula retiformator]TWT38502.1 FMN-dependent NADPH-azoreductase [Blastopirellula retiformator]
MTKVKVLAFAGSARRDSHNKQVISIAAAGATAAGGDVTLIDLADYPLPIFNEDLEADGRPENVKKLKQLFLEHDALLLSCPEYNSSITPLLKNTIDWVSRPDPGEPRLAAYRGKVAAIMSASPGALGGLRGLVHVRSILSNIGVVVLPEQIAVPDAANAFSADGSLKDLERHAAIHSLGETLVHLASKLQS